VLTITLKVLDDDPGETDRLSRALRTELLGLDVARVDLVLDRHVPPNAKADPGTVTAIVVAVSGSPVLVQLGRVLRDWVNRANGRKIAARDGNRSIEITGASTEDSRKALDEFFNRPEET
jgi:Effector Associated Constant Component 1